jgi:uncharacterized delta-60 repeat protein
MALKSTLHPIGLLFVFALLVCCSALGQSLDPSFHIPEVYRNAGALDAIQQADGKWVILARQVGQYERVENLPYRVSVVRYNADGSLDQAFVQNAGSLTAATAVQQLPNGQLLFLNGKWQQGAVQRSYLVRLNADGTLDPGLNVPVPATQYPNYTAQFADMVVQPDGKVVLVATNSSGMMAAEYIMRLLPDGTPDPGFNVGTGANDSVTAVEQQPDGKLVIGGTFTLIDGIPRRSLARLLTDGRVDQAFQGPVFWTVKDMAIEATGSILVASDDRGPSGSSNGLVRLTANGALDPSLVLSGPYANRPAEEVQVLPNGQILALFNPNNWVNGGYIFQPGTQVARLQSSGAADASLQQGSGANNFVLSIWAQSNGDVLLAGTFGSFSGQRRDGVALLQSTGALSAGLAPRLQFQGLVTSVARQSDGKLWITGDFNSIDGQRTDGLARLLPDGQYDSSFHFVGSVGKTIAVQPDGRLLVLGSVAAGQAVRRLLVDGTPDPSFATTLQYTQSYGGIRFLQVQPDGRILVGGGIIDQAGKVGITRLLPTGQVDNSFVPPNQAEPLLLQPDGNILVTMPPVAPATGYSLRRLLPDGTLQPNFSYPLVGFGAYPTPSFYSLGGEQIAQLPLAGGYLVSGVFSGTQGLERLSNAGSLTPGYAPGVLAYVGPAIPLSGIRAMAEQNDQCILVGGMVQLATLPSFTTRGLARLLPGGQLDASFDISFLRQTPPVSYATAFEYVSVTDLLVEPSGAILVVGYFDQAGSQAVSGLVRLLPAGVLPVNADRSGAAPTAVWPVPARSVLNLTLDAAAQPRRVTLFDAQGRAALTVAEPQPALTLNTASLLRGLYLLRVDYASGPVTRRVVLE